jgi:hypothetical protein
VVFERPEPKFETVILDPSYGLAMGVGAIALFLTLLNRWAGLVVGLFAIFLAIQATILRIHFTATALDLYRGKNRLKTFPYADWTHWEIFWPRLPILFYFNEVNNIHFVPMLFNPQQLADCTRARCPRLASPVDGSAAAKATAAAEPLAQVQESTPAKGSLTD